MRLDIVWLRSANISCSTREP